MSMRRSVSIFRTLVEPGTGDRSLTAWQNLERLQRVNSAPKRQRGMVGQFFFLPGSIESPTSKKSSPPSTTIPTAQDASPHGRGDSDSLQEARRLHWPLPQEPHRPPRLVAQRRPLRLPPVGPGPRLLRPPLAGQHCHVHLARQAAVTGHLHWQVYQVGQVPHAHHGAARHRAARPP